MYRNDWDAAVARATALEAELRQAQQAQSQDHQQIAALTAQLQAARAELARLQSGGPQQMPMGNPYAQPYGHPGMYQQMASYMYPNRGGTVLVLGILSLVVCAIMGPIAWSMGNEEIRRIDAGQAPPDGRGNANAGKICGIISSVLMIGMVVLMVFAFILAASADHHSRY
jgi:hypothetical protein